MGELSIALNTAQGERTELRSSGGTKLDALNNVGISKTESVVVKLFWTR